MAAKKSDRQLTKAQAERQTKAAAQKRRMTIELSEEQLAQLTAQYRKLNPAEAAELVFTVKRRPQSTLKIAGYSYSGDTCCA
jgi:hypothetical protein